MGAILALASCINDKERDNPKPAPTPSKTVTFVVSAPASDASVVARRNTRETGAEDINGGNGHFPEGVPESYRNYNADADTGKYGTLYGGYPDAGAEAAAFAKAVEAMTENFGNSPAARSEGAGVRNESTKGQDTNVATRAIPEGSIHDNRIDEIAVLFFDNNCWVDTKYVDNTDLSRVDGDLTRWKFTIPDMEDGDYTAVFVANASNDVRSLATIAGHSQMVALFPDGLPFEYVRAMLESSYILSDVNRWNIYPDDSDFKAFPMASQPVQFSIPLDRNFTEQPVEMLRAMAKINLRIDDDLVVNQGVRIEQIVVRNYFDYGFLLPSADWGARTPDDEIDMFDENAANPGGNHIAPPTSMTYDYPSYTTQSVDEIFVWEQLGSEVMNGYTDLNRDLCLMVKLAPGFSVPTQSGGSLTLDESRWFRLDIMKKENPTDANPKHVNIYRNFVYDITITGINTRGYGGANGQNDAYSNPPAGLTYDINARDAHDGDAWMIDNTWNGKYQITTDRSVVVIGPDANEEATVNIYTDYSGGFTSSMPVFSGGGALIVTGGSSAANTTQATPLTIKAGSYWNGNHVRKTTFSIFAGELHKSITVIQLPSPHNVMAGIESVTDVTDYTGAFWRADQRGERLIGLKGGKDWSAFVLGGADWVVMDSKPSTDPNVGTTNAAVHSGNDTGFETEHTVNSTVGWVSGKASEGKEYFRLGLRNSHAATPDAPARYALVYVVEGYVNSTSKLPPNRARLLYLRQGHEADYLFPRSQRPGDANMRFSPYNLTVPAAKRTGAYETDGVVPLDARGAVFTDYPTQAGAMFRGVTPSLRAIHPVKDIDPAIWGDVTLTIPYNTSAMESCPYGYRRPTGETITDEVPQSLWLNTSVSLTDGDMSNSIFGYYADGYFDRRSIGTPASANNVYPNSAVEVDLAGVAYQGNLYFNPLTGASIFMPAAGYKSNVGISYYLGRQGVYWTSSMTNDTNNDDTGSQLHFGDYYGVWSSLIPTNWQRGDAGTVRCVKMPEYEAIPSLVPAPPGVIGIKHTDLIAMRNGTKSLEANNGPSGSYVEFPQAVSPTIKGSSTYKGTWVERIATNDPNIGQLEDEPVYMLYFKWGYVAGFLGRDGSLPAGQAEMAWGIPSDSADVFGAGGVITYTNRIGFHPHTGPANGTAPDASGYDLPRWVRYVDWTEPGGESTSPNFNSWGDPCEFVNGATNVNRSGWRTPLGNPWTYFDAAENTGTPFGTTPQPVAGNALWRDESGSVPAGLASNDGSIFLPAAGFYNNTGVFTTDAGAYWTASSSTFNSYFNGDPVWNIYSMQFNSSQLQPTSIARQDYAMPIRCINCDPYVGKITVTVSVESESTGTTMDYGTSDPPEFVIGNYWERATMTATVPSTAGATLPATWHWEYSIGNDETSWIEVPDSEGKTTLVTSTHDDEPGIDFTMVGGKNRFRVVLSNPCSREVSNTTSLRLTLPAMTYAIIGTGAWSWVTTRRPMLTNATTRTDGVLSASNPTATIKTAGFSELWHTGNINGGASGTDDLKIASKLLRYGKTSGGVYTDGSGGAVAGAAVGEGAYPDVLLFYGFETFPVTWDPDFADALNEYVDKGGTVLFAPAADTDIYAKEYGTVISKLFPGTESFRQDPDHSDSTYRIWDLINNDGLEDDPIVNGPFGNLSGGDYYVGDENNGTVIIKNLPPGSVQIAAMRHPMTTTGGPLGTGTAGYPKEWSLMWYNKAKNFVSLGDCTGVTTTSGTDGYVAFYNTTTGQPGSKLYGYWDSVRGTKMTYNAVLEMNALAWCMTRAARNGRNPH